MMAKEKSIEDYKQELWDMQRKYRRLRMTVRKFLMCLPTPDNQTATVPKYVWDNLKVAVQWKEPKGKT